jgi:hypothetical protein
MQNKKSIPVLLGLDVGHINTRASLFDTVEGKYRLLGEGSSPTSVGMNLGSGAGSAIRALQRGIGYQLLKTGSGLIMPSSSPKQGVDQMALVASEGEPLRTVLLGLTAGGSLAAGLALIDSLPLSLVEKMGIADLAHQPEIVDTLVNARPELILIVGGVEEGDQVLVSEWVEVTRLVLRLLPERAKPVICFAGHTVLHPFVSRRLEPLAKVYNLPNLFPKMGVLDLVPAQACLNKIILQIWEHQLSGLAELSALSSGLKSTVSFAHNRSVRYLGEVKGLAALSSNARGVLALNLGGGETLLSVKSGDHSGTILQHTWPAKPILDEDGQVNFIHQWAPAAVSIQEVQTYINSYAVHPYLHPDNKKELAIHHAIARYRMQRAMAKFEENYAWFGFSSRKGFRAPVQSIFVSGSVLTQAPLPGQVMMMILDGLQPMGVTKIHIDCHHLLPLLGLMGEIDPVLSVHVMRSDAFSLLGTVISPVSETSPGKPMMSVQVTPDIGKNYSIDVFQGTLKRLVIPAGNSAVIEVETDSKTDVGFGGFGRGGYFRVPSGLLGVVIDARGRPFYLPEDDDERVAKHQQWLGVLGG